MRGCVLLLLGSLVGCGSVEPVAHLPADCRQVLIVHSARSPVFAVTVEGHERDETGNWRVVFAPQPGTVGRNGTTPAALKKEGDGCTPQGIYPIRLAFGYAPTLDTKLNYRQATLNDYWIDDPKSDNYNRWVSRDRPPESSFELMHRNDTAYKLGAVIEYNTHPVVPGKGSAIFLHVWGGPDHPTAGCVALPEDELAKILAWLDLSFHPHIVVMSPTENTH